jgi:hypothetical protein
MFKHGSKFAFVIVGALLLHSCGGGSSDSGDGSDLGAGEDVPVDAVGIPPMEVPSSDDVQVPVDPDQAGMFEDLDSTTIGGDDGTTANAELSGLLVPTIFETATSVDLAYAQAGAALVEQLNESLLLPVNVNVIFADCGTANAFFVPAPLELDGNVEVTDGNIIMCHELTELFSGFYDEPSQGFLASSFVLMHELGHALVEVLDLPVVGIEESYVDAVAAVFLGESGLAEGSVLAGWFFGAQGDTPFFDTHRAGPQRLGDLACWGVGADDTLLDDPLISSLATQLFDGGRNCTAEYADQVRALDVVLGANVVGGLGVLDTP